MVNINNPYVAYLHKIVDFVKENQHDLADKVILNEEYIITNGSPIFVNNAINKLAPFRLDCIQIGTLINGWYEPEVNMNTYRLEYGDLFITNYGAILNGAKVSDGALFKGISIKESYLRKIYKNKIPALYLDPYLCFKAHLKQEELQIFNSIITILLNLSKLKTIDHSKSIESIFVSALDLIISLHERVIGLQRNKLSYKEVIVDSFFKLVHKYGNFDNNVNFYASKLCVTPHNLGLIIKELTGESPKEWITKMLISKIQVELRYSNKSIKELADEFHFQSPSAFCRFFKHVKGISATNYRNLKDKEIFSISRS